jgi:hypothetical protein
MRPPEGGRYHVNSAERSLAPLRTTAKVKVKGKGKRAGGTPALRTAGMGEI